MSEACRVDGLAEVELPVRYVDHLAMVGGAREGQAVPTAARTEALRSMT